MQELTIEEMTSLEAGQNTFVNNGTISTGPISAEQEPNTGFRFAPDFP